MPEHERTLAQVALEELSRPPRMTLAQMARACGVTPTAVAAWRSGKAVPDDEHQDICERMLGIPKSHWRQIAKSRRARRAA